MTTGVDNNNDSMTMLQQRWWRQQWQQQQHYGNALTTMTMTMTQCWRLGMLGDRHQGQCLGLYVLNRCQQCHFTPQPVLNTQQASIQHYSACLHDTSLGSFPLHRIHRNIPWAKNTSFGLFFSIYIRILKIAKASYFFSFWEIDLTLPFWDKISK